jgi:tRNA(Ile2) C34 agmatinyltransferase TiaS
VGKEEKGPVEGLMPKTWENPDPIEPSEIEESADKRFYRCPECGQWVEYSNPKDVMAHLVHDTCVKPPKAN